MRGSLIAAKNIFALGVNSLLAKLASTIVYWAAARWLGGELFGRYSLVMALVLLFAFFSDLGLCTLITRDVAREREAARRYLGSALSATTPFSVATYGVLLGVMALFGYSGKDIALAAMAGLVLVPLAQLAIGQAVLAGLERLELSSLLFFVPKALNAVASVVLLLCGYGIVALFISQIIFHVLALGLMSVLLRRQGVPLSFRPDLRLIGRLLGESWPFAALMAVGLLYLRVDLIMLSRFANNEAVGQYRAAFLILEFLIFIPSTIEQALFPRLSSHFANSPDSVFAGFRQSLRLLLLIAFPVCGALYVFAPRIIGLLFTPEFAPAAGALKILAVVSVLQFANVAYFILLRNTTLVRPFTLFLVLILLVAVGLNYAWIPRYGIIGAALATLACKVLETILYFAFGVVILGRPWRTALIYLRPTLAGCACAGLLWLLDSSLGFFALLPALAGYLAVLFGLGEFDAEDRALARALWEKGKEHLARRSGN